MKKQILIIEDDPRWQKIFVALAQGSDRELLSATTLSDALTILKKTSLDLVITDINLEFGVPGNIDGEHFIRHLEASAPIIPVIIVSGTIPEDALNLPRDRTVRFLRKQKFSRQEFIQAVDQGLNFRYSAL